MSSQPFKLVVMVSGSGSNLQALIDAIEAGTLLQAQIIHVISNRENAFALERAAKHNIPTTVSLLKPYKTDGRGREQYDLDLVQTINELQPDLIVLAGWMHILSEAFLTEVGCDVINLHPALPGQFAGTKAVERAFEAYQRGEIAYSGCMIHHVIPEVDAGDVIVQAIIPMFDDDTLEKFTDRMHQTEHLMIVQAVQQIQLKYKETSHE